VGILPVKAILGRIFTSRVYPLNALTNDWLTVIFKIKIYIQVRWTISTVSLPPSCLPNIFHRKHNPTPYLQNQGKTPPKILGGTSPWGGLATQSVSEY